MRKLALAALLSLPLLACGQGKGITEPTFTEHDLKCLNIGMMTPLNPGEPPPFDGTVYYEQYGTEGWVYPGCSASWDKVTGGRS